MILDMICTDKENENVSVIYFRILRGGKNKRRNYVSMIVYIMKVK